MHATKPALGLVRTVATRDIDATEYMAADWTMASNALRYLTRLNIARDVPASLLPYHSEPTAAAVSRVALRLGIAIT